MSDPHDARFACEGCGKRYRWKPELAGRKVRCKCGQIMRVPQQSPGEEQAREYEIDLADLEPRADQGQTSSSPPSSPALSCPSCGGDMSAGSVLCLQCGYNLSTGRKTKGVSDSDVEREEEPKTSSGYGWLAGRFILGVGAGAAAAVVCGVLWGAVAAWTGYELGILAIAVGGITGISVAFFAAEGNSALGVAAAGLALAGLMLGKILIVQWAVAGVAVENVQKNPMALSQAMMWDSARDRGWTRTADWIMQEVATIFLMLRQEGPGAVSAHLSGRKPPPKVQRKLKTLVSESLRRRRELNKAEKHAIVEQYVQAVLGHISFRDQISLVLSYYDALWGILALATAYKVGSSYSITGV